MGQLETNLYCCSSDMIDDVVSGNIDIAYNVLGSYANNHPLRKIQRRLSCRYDNCDV